MYKRKIGEKVTIRQWDDMVNKYGVDTFGDIDCRCCFLKEMKKYCGKKLTITGIHNTYYDTNIRTYSWSEDMFEPPMGSIEFYLEKKGKI